MTEGNGPRLVLFDFDGTLTRKDTLPEVIRFMFGKRRFYAGLLRLFPFLFFFKLKLIPNWKAKERVLTYFLSGLPCDTFQQKCNQFAIEKLPGLLRNEAMNTLMQFKQEGARVVIVSASAENWIASWCETLELTCIATRLEVKDGKLTGKMKGKNCYGIEKVNRIKQMIDLSKYPEIYAYGDSKGDMPMLQLATNAYYRVFNGMRVMTALS